MYWPDLDNGSGVKRTKTSQRSAHQSYAPRHCRVIWDVPRSSHSYCRLVRLWQEKRAETEPGELAEHAGATRKEVNTRKLYSEGREDDLASV